MSVEVVNDVGFEPSVSFSVNEKSKEISVVIETARLILKSVEATNGYYDKYASLFGDAEVMATYANGKPKDRDWVINTIQNLWAKRWKEGDPYSAFAVFKKDTDEFIGHVAFGHGYEPGQTVMGFLFHKEYWNQKYGTEAVSAVVHQYAQELIQRSYQVGGLPLREAVATTLPTNTASIRLQQRIGMTFQKYVEEYGTSRHLYSYSYSA